MRTCKWCNKSGWFLSLSKDGYCQSCEAEVKSNIIHATQVLNESMRLMKRGKDLDLRLSKAKVAIQKLRELLPYYQKGLVKLKPSPQEWVTRIHSEERKMANQHIGTLLKDAIRRAQQVQNADQRSSVFELVEEAIQKYGDHLGKANKMRWLSRIESEMGYLIKDLENAMQKTSERDIALAQYKETLDMIKAEFSGSREQIMEIRRIEKLIRDLGGDVPQPPAQNAPSPASSTSDDDSPLSTPQPFLSIPEKKTGTS